MLFDATLTKCTLKPWYRLNRCQGPPFFYRWENGADVVLWESQDQIPVSKWSQNQSLSSIYGQTQPRVSIIWVFSEKIAREHQGSRFVGSEFSSICFFLSWDLLFSRVKLEYLSYNIIWKSSLNFDYLQEEKIPNVYDSVISPNSFTTDALLHW